MKEIKNLTVSKHAFGLERHGIDYSWHEMGLSVEIESWVKAFEELGFERINREVAEKIEPFDKPQELQDSNTYNDNTNLANDINYGLNPIHPTGAMEAERPDLEGGTLLVFKEHKGGDIRGAYKQAVYMVHPDPEDVLIHDLFDLLSLEVEVKVEDQNGNTTNTRIDPMGYQEYMEDAIGLDDHDIMELMEKTGSTKMQTVSYEVEE